MADIARGITPKPAAPPKPEPPSSTPTFHEFAAEWWQLKCGEWSAGTTTNYRWRLEQQLLPRFAHEPLDRIDFAAVEKYVAEKHAAGLSPRSINLAVKLMAAILEVAVERELIPRNPAKGKGRRVREHAPERSYIDSADGIAALLAAAKSAKHRATLATAIFTGLRVSELCNLRWRHVDLASGWLGVGEAKTEAGVRRARLRGIVRDELGAIRPPDAHPDALVFKGPHGRQHPRNVERLLSSTAESASESLAKRDLPPLPRLTPHSLRRTFASVLYALGESPVVVAAEMGHESPTLALAIYAQVMGRNESEAAALRAMVEGGVWADDWADEQAKASKSQETQAAPLPTW